MSDQMSNAEPAGEFPARHIGPNDAEQRHMLDRLGYRSLDELIDAAVPESIRTAEGPALPAPRTEPRPPVERTH